MGLVKRDAVRIMLNGDRLGRMLRRTAVSVIHIGARITRPMIMGVRAIVFDEAGHVLLVRHGYLPGWHFPGGGIETGETARTALERELSEEARLAIHEDPVLHGVFLHRRRDHVLVYVVRTFDRLGIRQPNWEIREARFFDPRALPEGTTAATRRRLAEILDGVARTETW